MFTPEQLEPLLPNVSTWPKGWDTTDPEERSEAAVWLSKTLNTIHDNLTAETAMSERPQ